MKRLLVVALLIALATGEPSGRRIRGVVLDPKGRTLSGARVSLRSAHSSCLLVFCHSFLEARTDGAGAFSFAQPPKPMELLVEHPDYAPTWAPAREGTVLRMRQAAYVSGTLSAPCRVRARIGTRALATAEGDGSFRLGPLPPGSPITILAESDRHRPFLRTLTLEEGQDQALDIVLDEGLALTGRVVPPQEGVVLRASQGEARESRAVTDATGAFRLTGLREGAVCLVVLAAGRDPLVVYRQAAEFTEVRLDR